MRRFCQLVLAACLAVAVAVAVPASWMDMPAGGGNVIGMSFLFVSRIGWARRWRFVSFIVPFLVSWGVSFVLSSRFLSCLSSRVIVPFVSRGLAFSCRRFVCRVGVGVSLLISLFVSCCCLVLSSRVGVVLLCRFCQLVFSCRLVCFSSLPSLYSCSFCRACRVAACRVAGRGVGRFGDVVSCGGACGAGGETRRMARRRAGR